MTRRSLVLLAGVGCIGLLYGIILLSSLQGEHHLHHERERDVVTAKRVPNKLVVVDWFTESGCTGIENEAVNLVVPLAEALLEDDSLDAVVQIRSSKDAPFLTNPCPGYPPNLFDPLQQLVERNVGRDPDVIIHVGHIAFKGVCGIPDAFGSLKGTPNSTAKEVYVARPLWETDGIWPDEAKRCAEWEDIWVPTEFARGVLQRAGIPTQNKVRIIGEAVQVDALRPAVSRALQVPKSLKGLLTPEDNGAFRFLSIFKWEERKNWFETLTAFIDEFVVEDRKRISPNLGKVVLLIKTSDSFGATPKGDIDGMVGFLARRWKLPMKDLTETIPKWLRLSTQMIPAADMPALYGHADAFILTSHGEGWGLPLAEAMAAGLPTIGTRWGGSLAFMNDENSFLVDVKEEKKLSQNKGKWAVPDTASIRKEMRRVVEDRDEAQRRGHNAERFMAEHFSGKAVAALIHQRVHEIVAEQLQQQQQY